MAPATPPTAPARPPGSSPALRLAATLVLIPAVPLLVVSVAALAFHYASPARFGQLLSRLPGDNVIRIALAFAPATLFAVVILAFLYARDVGPAVPAPAVTTAAPKPRARPLALVVLGIVMPLLVGSIAVLGLSFVSPDRFHQIIDPLPGTFLIRSGVRIAPLVLAVIALLALIAAVRAGGTTERRRELPWRFARVSAGLILVPTVPMLLASLAGFALLFLAPERLEGWLGQLTGDGFVRLVLAIAPVALVAVVLLAALTLSASSRSRRAASIPSDARGRLGVLVLAGGLALTALAGLGLLGAAILALLR